MVPPPAPRHGVSVPRPRVRQVTRWHGPAWVTLPFGGAVSDVGLVRANNVTVVNQRELGRFLRCIYSFPDFLKTPF